MSMLMGNRIIQLSKSRFMAGIQCPKRLYLITHPPESNEEQDDGRNLQIINGYEVGDMACKLYPGEMVTYKQGLAAALDETKRLVADENVSRIHEATFSYENVLVRVDLLERSASGWVLTEVKAATSVKSYYITDAAIQAWVLQGYGLTLASVNLMHVNNEFVYQGNGDYHGLLHAEDISDSVLELLPAIGDKKSEFVRVLESELPDVEIGEQCDSPFTCEFVPICQKVIQPEFPVSLLPRCGAAKRKELLDAGYADVRDIPDGVLTNENHQRVWRATKADKEELNLSELSVVKDWSWPRYYLDFETINLAVPRWEGVRPYSQVPFQWSCHIHQADGKMSHVEFLDVTGGDPRRACAEGLVEHIGKEGVLVAYNAGFEKRVIRELAQMYPDLSDALLEMNERFVDLLPVARAGYYHPSQKGSWSIKAVLPALVPELNYSDLDGVQDGGDAQIAWYDAADKNDEKRALIAKQLLEYCKLDTWAMVKIVEVLQEKIKSYR